MLHMKLKKSNILHLFILPYKQSLHIISQLYLSVQLSFYRTSENSKRSKNHEVSLRRVFVNSELHPATKLALIFIYYGFLQRKPEQKQNLISKTLHFCHNFITVPQLLCLDCASSLSLLLARVVVVQLQLRLFFLRQCTVNDNKVFKFYKARCHHCLFTSYDLFRTMELTKDWYYNRVGFVQC